LPDAWNVARAKATSVNQQMFSLKLISVEKFLLDLAI
jgi:hypothetical protein